MQINTGTHTLKLYSPPVPDPSRIPFDEIPGNNDWRRYGKGTLRINIFQGNPRPGSLTPSDMSEDGEEVLPEYSWLPCERSKPCRDPFLSGDGFDVYVDGSRYLPDSVTFTKVSIRMLYTETFSHLVIFAQTMEKQYMSSHFKFLQSKMDKKKMG